MLKKEGIQEGRREPKQEGQWMSMPAGRCLDCREQCLGCLTSKALVARHKGVIAQKREGALEGSVFDTGHRWMAS